MKRIVAFRDPMDLATVGGKFARQRTMAAAGLPIPPFYCLTVAVYEAVFETIRGEVEAVLRRVDWSRADSVGDASLAIGRKFAGARLDPALTGEVLHPWSELFGPGTLVSVRGSMVGHREEEGEDSAEHAFAGMSESFLCVPKEEVLARVRDAWASGFSPEALLYRRAQGMDPLGFSVAVGVQEMVQGDRSFVLFTCEPKSAARDTVVVASYGLGEGVVQEKVACDHFFLRRTTGEIEREVVPKPERLVLNAGAGHGIAPEAVEPELRDAPCLSDDELRRLDALGQKVEALFGAPQDVEGTIRNGTVFLLQARPITIDYSRQRVWSNANITESFPGVTTALTFSFARFFYRRIFHDGYRLGGVSMGELHGNLRLLDRMLGFLGGRVYYNLTSFYRLHRQNALFFTFERDWLRMMALTSTYQTGVPPERRSLPSKAWRLVVHSAYQVVAYLAHDRRQRRFYAWWEELFGPLRGKRFDRDDPVDTLETFWRVWTEVGREWGVTLFNDTYLPMIYGLAETSLERWGLLEQDPGLLSDLLCGDEGVVSVEIVRSAVRLGEQARANPELRATLERLSPEAVWAALEAGELPATFSGDVRRHLAQYGDRGLHELKIEQPSLRDDPAALIRTVQGYIRSDVTVAGLVQAERARREAAEVRLERALGLRLDRLLLMKWATARIRALLRYRENSRYCRSELFGFSRAVFQGLAATLVREGRLREANDAHHLTQDELFGAIDGTGVTDDLQAIADLRRREAAAHAQEDLAESITTVGAVRQDALALRGPRGDASGELRGLGSSPGRAVGTARLVLDPTAPVDVTDDMILVARETDPGWMFLMLAAKGIVVERGSMLSHTAITGRKFGIPTVVAVAGATTRIPDGARIEIDGASGQVALLDEPARAGGTTAPEASPAADAPPAADDDPMVMVVDSDEAAALPDPAPESDEGDAP